MPGPGASRAGTINNARQFGLANDFGTVEVGKHANLLLLDANPLAAIEARNQIDTVILHGNATAREKKRLTFSRTKASL